MANEIITTKEDLPEMPNDNPVLSQLDLGEPSQEILDWAKEQIGEDPETRCQALAELRDLIYERGECMPHRTDDSFLLRFLRARYFVVRHAHRMLINYCDFRENNPEYFVGVCLSHLRKIGDYSLITVPPYREQTGRRILLYRWGMWDPEIFTVEDVFQATMLVLELAILEQRAQILGGICIMDLGGLTMQKAWYMTPSIAHKMFQIMVTSVPMKIEAVHIVNQPWIFDTVYKLFKPLLTETLENRIFFHGSDMESLHKHINPQFLPKRYGGVHADYDYSDWIQWFKSSETIRWELTSLGYNCDDETKALEDNETENTL